MSIRLDSSTKPSAKPATYRADIQGLRAVAVIAVIADHLFGWPAGGFIGVDVFFVISGFLITGLMTREHEKTGSISWVNFYKRRVRRIVPAATVCLIVVVAASYVIYRTARFSAILEDGIWSFFFMSNWHFAATGTDYWADVAVSPLQHFWSLAVEEQFYIVWPVLLIVVLGVAGRRLRVRGRSVALLLLVVLGAVALASLVWAIWETATSPTWAYFSTFARGWELAVGALLAVTVGRLARMPTAVRPLLSYGGLIAIAVGLFVITSNSPFPGPWAVIPVLGAAMVIAAGVGGTPGQLFPLTNPGSVYVGKISYSLYLWHFPVIILLAATMNPDSIAYYAFAILIMVALAVASFHFVEDAVRRSAWLDAGGRRSSPKRQRRRGAGFGYAAICALAVATATVSVLALQVPTAQPLAAVSTSQPLPSQAPEPGASGAQEALSAQIDTALGTAEWPDLTPSVDEVTADDYAGGDCGPDRQDRTCLSNQQAPKTALVVGDSTAGRFVLTARAALWNDYNVTSSIYPACPVAPAEIRFKDAATEEACRASRLAVVEQIISAKPDVVFLISNAGYAGHLKSGAIGDAQNAEWKAAYGRFMPQIVASAGTVILVAPPPEGESLAECATSTSRPPACVMNLSSQWYDVAKRESEVASSVGAKYWDTSRWYCSESGRCPSFVMSTLTRIDNIHITLEYAKMLIPVLDEKLKETLAG